MNGLRFFLFGLLVLVCNIGSAKTADVMLSELLQTYTTYSASFTQQTLNGSAQVVSSSSGKVTIKKPDSFFWETLEPTHQQLFGVKNILWIYDVDLAQATKRPVSAPGQLTPAMMLAGDGSELSKYYDIVSLPQASRSESKFKLSARASDAAFSSVVVTFDNQQLVQLMTENNLGQSTVFKFTNITINKPLPSDFFVFDPKKMGVDVLQEPPK